MPKRLRGAQAARAGRPAAGDGLVPGGDRGGVAGEGPAAALAVQVRTTGERAPLRGEVSTVGRGRAVNIRPDDESVLVLHAKLVCRGPRSIPATSPPSCASLPLPKKLAWPARRIVMTEPDTRPGATTPATVNRCSRCAQPGTGHPATGRARRLLRRPAPHIPQPAGSAAADNRAHLHPCAAEALSGPLLNRPGPAREPSASRHWHTMLRSQGGDNASHGRSVSF